MKILLAPSETKIDNGTNSIIDLCSLYECQNTILDEYSNHIKNLTIDELSIWFGIKNLQECSKYQQDIKTLPTMKAIQRYTGVAFDAINYNQLNNNAQDYIDNNVYIYSNLFGILKSNTLIPNYKFKQGALLPNINNEKYYKEHLKNILDNTLSNEILDLSANYYTKIYKPIAPTIKYKFLKDNKVVSHWAKHYRGELVKQIALNNITNFDQLLNHNFDNIRLKEIQESKNTKTIVVDII